MYCLNNTNNLNLFICIVKALCLLLFYIQLNNIGHSDIKSRNLSDIHISYICLLPIHCTRIVYSPVICHEKVINSLNCTYILYYLFYSLIFVFLYSSSLVSAIEIKLNTEKCKFRPALDNNKMISVQGKLIDGLPYLSRIGNHEVKVVLEGK